MSALGSIGGSPPIASAAPSTTSSNSMAGIGGFGSTGGLSQPMGQGSGLVGENNSGIGSRT